MGSGMSVGGIFGELTLKTDQFKSALDGAVTDMKNAGDNMARQQSALANTVKNVSLAFTAAYTGIVSGSVAAATSFDKNMRMVNSVLQLNESQFEQLRGKIMDFSMTTRSTANDVAMSMYHVASAGFESADAFKVMTAASRAAGAGLTDAETMARLVIGALRSYRMSADDAKYVTDIFLHSVRNGVMTLDDLQGSLGRLLPIAAQASISLEEASFSVARITQRGLSADEAVTRVIAVLMEVLRPTKEMTAAVQKMGYETAYAALETNGLNGFLKLLRDAGYNTADTLTPLFNNVRALSGVLALMSDDTAMTTGAVQEFADASKDAVEKARAEQYKSLSANLAKLKNAFTMVAIEIGTALLPKLVKLVEAILPVVQSFKNVDESTIKWGLAIGGLVAAIGPAVLTVGKFATAINALGTLFGSGAGAAGAAASIAKASEAAYSSEYMVAGITKSFAAMATNGAKAETVMVKVYNASTGLTTLMPAVATATTGAATAAGGAATAFTAMLSSVVPFLLVAGAFVGALVAVKLHQDKVNAEQKAASDQLYRTSQSWEQYRLYMLNAGLANRTVTKDIWDAREALVKQGKALEDASKETQAFSDLLKAKPIVYLADQFDQYGEQIQDTTYIDEWKKKVLEAAKANRDFMDAAVSAGAVTREEANAFMAHVEEVQRFNNATKTNIDLINQRKQALQDTRTEEQKAADFEAAAAQALLEEAANYKDVFENASKSTAATKGYVSMLDWLANAQNRSNLETERAKIVAEAAQKAWADYLGVLNTIGSAVMGVESIMKAADDAQAKRDADKKTAQEEAAKARAEAAAAAASAAAKAQEDQAKRDEAYGEKYAKVEADRAEKIAWVRTGAWKRTPEQEAEAEAYWNAQFDAEKAKITEKLSDEKVIVAKGYGDQNAAIQQKLDERLAAIDQEYAAEIEKQRLAMTDQLTLMALNVMQQTGMLQQFFGNYATTAQGAYDLIKNGLVNVSPELQAAFSGIYEGFQNQFGGAVTQAGDNMTILAGLMDATIPKFADLQNAATGGGQGVADLGKGMADAKSPAEGFRDVLADVKPKTDDVTAGINDLRGVINDQGVPAIQLMTGTSRTLSETLSGIPQMINDAKLAYADMGNAVAGAGAVMDIVGGNMANIQNTGGKGKEMDTFLSDLKRIQGESKAVVEDTVKTAGDTFKNGIPALTNDLSYTFNQAMNKAKPGAVSDFEVLGAASMQGAERGVTKEGTDFAAAVADWVNRAYQAGLAAAGAHSPSKLFMGLGASIMQGVEVGMDKQAEGGGGGLPSMWDTFANIIEKLRALADKFGDKDAWERFGTVAGVMKELVDLLAGAGGSLRRVSTFSFHGVDAKLGALFDALKPAIEKAMELARKWNKDEWDRASAVIGDMGGLVGVVKAAQELGSALQHYKGPSMADLGEKAATLVESLFGLLKTMNEKLKDVKVQDFAGVVALTEVMSPVFGMLKDALDVMEGFNNYHPSLTLTGKIKALVAGMSEIINEVAKGLGKRSPDRLADLSDVLAEVAPIIDFVKDAAEAVQGVADLDVGANMTSNILNLTYALELIIKRLAALPGKVKLSDDDLYNLKEFSTSVKDAVLLIGDAVKVVADIGATRIGAGLGNSIEMLANYIGKMATEIIRVRAWRKAIETWEQVAEFAKAISGGMQLFTTVLEVTEKVRKFRPVSNFGKMVEMLANYIGKLATEILRVRAWRQAMETWEQVGEFSKSISGGMQLFTTVFDIAEKVRHFRPVVGFGKMVETIANYIGKLAVELIRVRQWREDIKTWEQVGEFAKAISGGMELFKTVMDVADKMRNFRIPTGFGTMAERLADMIEQLLRALLRIALGNEKVKGKRGKVRSGEASDLWGPVGEFVDAIGGGIGIYKDALDVLDRLRSFRPVSDFDKRLGDLTEQMFWLIEEIRQMGEITARIPPDLNPLDPKEYWGVVGDFVDSIGGVMNLYKDALDVLSQMRTFKPMADFDTKLDLLMGNVFKLVDAVRKMALLDFGGFKFDPRKTLDPKDVEDYWGPAGKIATIVKDVMEGIKGTFDVFDLFRKGWKPIREDVVTQFMRDLYTLIHQMKRQIVIIGLDALDDAKDVAERIGPIGEALKNIVGGMLAIGSYGPGKVGSDTGEKAPTTKQIEALFADVKTVIEKIREIVDYLLGKGEDVIKQINDGAEMIAKIGDALSIVEAMQGIHYYMGLQRYGPTGKPIDTLGMFKRDLFTLVEAMMDVEKGIREGWTDDKGKYHPPIEDALDRAKALSDIVGGVGAAVTGTEDAIMEMWKYVPQLSGPSGIIQGVKNNIVEMLLMIASIGEQFGANTTTGGALSWVADVLEGIRINFSTVLKTLIDYREPMAYAGFDLGRTIGESIAAGLNSTQGDILQAIYGALRPIDEVIDAVIERLPQGAGKGGGGGGNTTFNFTLNGVALDNDQRLNQLADRISAILGGKTRRRHTFTGTAE